MLIEIKGAANYNKGAEMMLLTILQELQSDGTRFTVAPKYPSCQYPFYSKLNIYPKLWLDYRGCQFGKLGGFIPKKIRDMYGLVIDREVDVFLDSSGFAYSSQWGGPRSTKIMAKNAKKWKKDGRKIILMPQAFGPFDTKAIRKNMKTIIENASLIYARDVFSYEALLDILNDEKIKLTPDFTSLLKGTVPDYFDSLKHQVCIVPNMRMVDMKGDMVSYLTFNNKIISCLQNNGINPFFLIHGGPEDLAIAKTINDGLENKMEVINESNPYFIKGIIGKSIGLIGSRYHSLASALNCGTVAIGAGWSHKYKYLFDDFDFQEGLITVDSSEKILSDKLNLLIDAEKRKAISNKLKDKSDILKDRSNEMFKEIRTFLSEQS